MPGSPRPQTVSPGLHRHRSPTVTSYELIWWDPAALTLGTEPPFGLRRQELIARDVEPEIVAAGQRRYIAWREQRARSIESGMAPSLRVQTTTEWARSADEAPLGTVARIELDAAVGRPGGTRHGTLVHAALAAVPLDAEPATQAAVVATQARIIGATAEEVMSATTIVATVLSHPLLAAARQADERGALYRETPVTLMADGVLIEGVVDLAFEQDEVMTVIDFKTDNPQGDVRHRYERQVALYAEAIARATGLPARAVLLQV